MHKSNSFWQGLRDGVQGNKAMSDVGDACCTKTYIIGHLWGRQYTQNRDKFKTKLYWLAPLGAGVYLLVDRILHFFGICIGG